MGNAAPDLPGQALTRLRLAAGLSARQLAERAGVSHALISKAERGRAVTRDALAALEGVLGPGVKDAVTVWPAPPSDDTPVARACRESGEWIAQVAKRAGVSNDVMGRAATGERVHPANALKIAHALGLDVADVLPLPPPANSTDRQAA